MKNKYYNFAIRDHGLKDRVEERLLGWEGVWQKVELAKQLFLVWNCDKITKFCRFCQKLKSWRGLKLPLAHRLRHLWKSVLISKARSQRKMGHENFQYPRYFSMLNRHRDHDRILATILRDAGMEDGGDVGSISQWNKVQNWKKVCRFRLFFGQLNVQGRDCVSRKTSFTPSLPQSLSCRECRFYACLIFCADNSCTWDLTWEKENFLAHSTGTKSLRVTISNICAKIIKIWCAVLKI